MGSISPEVTCFSSLSGGARAHFPAAACNGECCSIFTSFLCLYGRLFVVFPCGRVISGIIEVIVTFFPKGKEGAIECHCSCVPVDILKHKGKKKQKKQKTSNGIFRTERASPSVRNWRVLIEAISPGKILCG